MGDIFLRHVVVNAYVVQILLYRSIGLEDIAFRLLCQCTSRAYNYVGGDNAMLAVICVPSVCLSVNKITK